MHAYVPTIGGGVHAYVPIIGSGVHAGVGVAQTMAVAHVAHGVDGTHMLVGLDVVHMAALP